jgi:ribose-phosphate pyrophosphokinase
MAVIGNIKGKICIINDDIIDTGGTLVGSIGELKKKGAGDIYVCATHGVFSGPALERLQMAPIEECVVTNAIPCEAAKRPDSKVKQISVASELAEAIYKVYTNEATTEIFGGDLNL